MRWRWLDLELVLVPWTCSERHLEGRRILALAAEIGSWSAIEVPWLTKPTALAADYDAGRRAGRDFEQLPMSCLALHCCVLLLL